MFGMSRLTLVGSALLLLHSSIALAESWPAWRGAAGRGVSSESNLPTEWSIDKSLAWKIDLPGRSNSSPVVTSNRIYLTTQDKDNSLWVLSVDRADGRIVWKKNVGRGTLKTFGDKNLYAHRHNASTPSPTADEERVWAFFGTGLLVCLDRSGVLRWKRDLVKDYGPYSVRFGMASSPRVWGDLIYLVCLHKGPSYVVALNKSTGKEVWRTPRKLPAKNDGPDAYSSPIVLATKNRTELVVAGSDHVNAYDLLTGKQLWISSGLTIDNQYGRIIASPAVSDQVVVANSANPLGGKLGRAIAIKTGGSGDVTKSHRLWTYAPYTPDAPTPVCYEGRVYFVRDEGVGSCLDLKTGQTYWRKRISNGPFRASVLAGDGKVYFLNLDGLCTVIQSGPEGRVLARNLLPGTFFATPAISDGTIYLRGHRRLYAVSASSSTKNASR